MKRRRQIYFYLLVSLFVLTSPIVVFYAIGYRLNLVTGAIEKTGGIFIKSKTTSVSIFLDGAFEKRSSRFSGGAILPEIQPGVHHLRIEKEGYRPWSKRLAVLPEVVTEIRNILMLPAPLTVSTSTPEELKLITSLSAKEPPKLKIDKKDNLTLRVATTTRVLAVNVYAFQEIGDTILYVDHNGFLTKKNAEGKIDVLGRPGFFLHKNQPLKFVKSPKGDVAIIDSGDGLYILQSNKIKPIEGGVKTVSFDGNGSKILVQKEFEAKIIWLEENPYQPFQKIFDTEVVFTATDDEIRDARWYFGDNSHVIVRLRESVELAETDTRGGGNTLGILTENTDEVLTTPADPTKIFFRVQKNWFTIIL